MAKLLSTWDESPVKQAGPSSRQTVIDLLLLLPALRIAHWQASTKTNEHQALGDLYEGLGGLIDDYAEILMGTEGSRDWPGCCCDVAGKPVVSDLLDSLKTAATGLCSQSKTPDLQNIAADILQTVNKARYLLQ